MNAASRRLSDVLSFMVGCGSPGYERGGVSFRLSWSTALIFLALLVFGSCAVSNGSLPLPDLPGDDDGGIVQRQDGEPDRQHRGNRRGVSAADLRADLAAVQVTAVAPDVPGYDRDLFGSDWVATADGCDMRQQILRRDLRRETLDGCTVETGILNDPYTGSRIVFDRDDPMAVQIDHVFPLAAAWDAGAAAWDEDRRLAFANDPSNLLASDGPTNMSKSDSTPSEWLPPNSGYQCTYLHRYLNVADEYGLTITTEDAETTRRVGRGCRNR